MGLAWLPVYKSVVLVDGCFLLSLLALVLIILFCCAWEHFDNSDGNAPALADGQGIIAVSVLLYWTGWNFNVNTRQNKSADTKVSEERGGGGGPRPWSRDSPAVCVS